MDRLEQQINFIIEIDKCKNIIRQNFIIDGSRKENDAEHSWHMAMMCVLLSQYANEEIDVLKTMKMILIHDLVEIDAGDTYAYDDKNHETKKVRELAAADRIFNILPKDQASELRELWDEFEEGHTPEAKFACTMDRLQPLILNSNSDGKSWREHGVKVSQILKRNETTPEGSRELWAYAEKLIKRNVEKGNIINE